MATKSQRRKQKQKRKREKKKEQRKRQPDLKNRSGSASGSNLRQRQRVSEQIPKAWPGELPEDAAVFEDSVLKSLSAETAEQVLAVRDALQLACESKGDEALKRVSGIARSSPLSQWRLFIRGLLSWLADDKDAAAETWSRLDFERRPGRMATAMMNALRTDLETDSKATANDGTGETSRTEWSDRLDDQLLYNAKLLRRVRFDRAALKIAESGVRAREESKELVLGPRKIRWLKRFASEYRETEPELTESLEQVGLGRAFAQNFSDIFEEAARTIRGPRHDRRNQLLTFFYFSRFGDPSSEAISDQALIRYLEKDLPQNQELSEPLRAAIASQIHLEEAKMEIAPPNAGPFSAMFQKIEDVKAIRGHLNASIKAYPANRSAYRTFNDWIETRLEDRPNKRERESLLNEKSRLMKSWSQGLPDDVEPRLWLVDHFFENEKLDEARPHVDWLASARQDDPRVRATPWKWQLLEAMRLCRRKAWLGKVPAHLEEAERLWPAWLSMRWLPYLKAAVTLRSGDAEAFEAQRQQICEDSGVERDSLADACMMLGAAQHMRVPSADLKPLRVPIDGAVKNLHNVSDEELLDVGSFFWDLHRTQLAYPAYRMHGGRIAGELFACLKENPKWVLEHLDDERVQTAILLSSEHRWLDDRYELRLPDWYSKPAVKQHPMFAAAKLNAVLNLRSTWRVAQYEELVSQLRELAPTARDSYYRYWFASMADELEDLIASNASGPFGFSFNAFSTMFGGDDEDDDEYDDDDDPFEQWGFDPNCDCPECTKARRAYEAAKR